MVALDAYSRTLAALTELQSAKSRREHCTGQCATDAITVLSIIDLCVH